MSDPLLHDQGGQGTSEIMIGCQPCKRLREGSRSLAVTKMQHILPNWQIQLINTTRPSDEVTMVVYLRHK